MLLWVNNHYSDFEGDSVMESYLETFEKGLEIQVSGRLLFKKWKFGFIKRVDKGRITTVKADVSSVNLSSKRIEDSIRSDEGLPSRTN